METYYSCPGNFLRDYKEITEFANELHTSCHFYPSLPIT